VLFPRQWPTGLIDRPITLTEYTFRALSVNSRLRVQQPLFDSLTRLGKPDVQRSVAMTPNHRHRATLQFLEQRRPIAFQPFDFGLRTGLLILARFLLGVVDVPVVTFA
jgi:hypothetical protein